MNMTSFKLTDNSLMPFGSYKGEKMINVPAKQLMWYYDQEWLEKKYPQVYEYIVDNMDAIKSEL